MMIMSYHQRKSAVVTMFREWLVKNEFDVCGWGGMQGAENNGLKIHKDRHELGNEEAWELFFQFLSTCDVKPK